MTLHCLPHYIRVFSTDIWWDVELRESPSFSSTMAVGAFSLSLAAILFLARADSDFLGGFSGRTWQWMYVIRIALLWLKLLCEIVKWGYDWKDCIVKIMIEKCVTLSILISWSARDMPCFTSIQRSVSSLRTSLVTRGVAGTTSYCWQQGALFCGAIIISRTYSYPLILYNLVNVGPFVWIGLQTFYKNEL